MTTRVSIQVDNGRITVLLGGQSAATAPAGEVLEQGTVGGNGSQEGTETGSGGPEQGGVLVLGPIIVPYSAGESGKQVGGNGSQEGTETGSGGPGGGIVVIGPIVMDGSGGGAVDSTSKAVAINPPA